MSQGVVSSINVLIDSGHVEEARSLQEKYNSYVDPLSEAKLAKKFKTVDLKVSAFKKVNEIERLPENQQLDAIEKIDDIELRSEVLKIKDTNNNRRDSLRDSRYKANYNTLAKQVLGKKYFGISDLEKDPIYKQTWDNLNAKGQQAIHDMIKAPKGSSSGSQVEIQNLFFGNNEEFEIETITPEEFQLFLSGLSKSDRKKYTSMFTKLRVESAGAQRENHRRANKFLINALLRHEEIEKNKFDKFDEDDTITIIEANNELIDFLDSEKGVFSDKQLKDFVNEFTAAKVEDRIFVPKPRRKTKKKRVDIKDLNLQPRELVDLKLKYRKQFGIFPIANSESFINFVNQNREER